MSHHSLKTMNSILCWS